MKLFATLIATFALVASSADARRLMGGHRQDGAWDLGIIGKAIGDINKAAAAGSRKSACDMINGLNIKIPGEN